MIRRRLSRVRSEVKERLVTALLEEHTPNQVAFSFSLGIFITALPSLGTGVLAFLVLAFLFDRLSKIAMFASVIVLNPVVKWGVYGTSYSLGHYILGPAAGISFDGVSLSAGPQVLARLWLGNLILATGFAVIAYIAGLRMVTAFRRRAREDDVPLVDLAPDSVTAED